MNHCPSRHRTEAEARLALLPLLTMPDSLPSAFLASGFRGEAYNNCHKDKASEGRMVKS